jgi:hypothetical protein
MPPESGYAVGWGTLALINAGLAQAKRRSGLLWFVVSLLLGPLATLLIVILPVPNVESRPLGRRDWAVVGLVLVAFLVLLLGLMAFSAGGVTPAV